MSNTIVTVRYVDNRSARYDGKEFQKLLSKIRREKNAMGSLKTSETVTIKTKSCLWKATVVNLHPNTHPTQQKKKWSENAEKSQPKKKRNAMNSAPLDPDIVACSIQHFHQLSDCSLVIRLHLHFNHGQCFGRELEASATSWQTRQSSLHLIFGNSSPNSLLGDFEAFCC